MKYRPSETNLYRISFYHAEGREFITESYCVGTEEVRLVTEESVRRGWKLNEVCCYESVLNEFLYNCYRMKVDA